MDILVTSATYAEAEEASVRDLLSDYIAWVAERARQDSGLEIDEAAYVAATMDNISAYLPPRGRLLLAQTSNGALVGMVFVKTLRPDTAEIKRLYVSPDVRGSGLGRRLMGDAVAAAAGLGAQRVFLDTGRWMTAALALYRDMGFREIAPYPESENDPSMAPYLVFMELRFAG